MEVTHDGRTTTGWMGEKLFPHSESAVVMGLDYMVSECKFPAVCSVDYCSVGLPFS